MRLLAQVPLVMDIMSHADNGEPVAVILADDPDAANAEARAFGHLADEVVAAVADRNRDLPATQSRNEKVALQVVLDL